MKRFLSVLLCAVLLSLSIPALSSCNKEDVLTLNVYNWEDYIACEDYDMVAEFEKYYEETYGKKVVVNYSTFGTCENMYNELQLTKKKDGTYSYDLVCPSDYMIQKMIKEDMLEPFDLNDDGSYSKITNYNDNVADFILDLFTSSGDEGKEWYKYATCYNWGTMGFTYNPNPTDDIDLTEAVKHWNVAVNEDYKNKITIKDSVRDTYILAIGGAYEDRLTALDKNAEDYTEQLNAIFNDFSETALKDTGDFLMKVKENIYGFEVDSGKIDMATGKLWINLAWSGDSVYAMDIAEESGTYLEYYVPEEGSNIFFDGWVMPKGANTDLAQEFLNFMYREDNAIENLDYICYSSPIVGEDVFSYVCENYGLTTFYEGEEVYVGDIIGDDYTEDTFVVEYEDGTTEEVPIIKYSVKDFFGDHIEGDGIIYTDNELRQLGTMYPTAEIRKRCIVMGHIEGQELKNLNNMWDSIKVGKMSPTLMIVIVAVFVAIVVLIAVLHFLNKKGLLKVERKKNYGKLIKSEKI